MLPDVRRSPRPRPLPVLSGQRPHALSRPRGGHPERVRAAPPYVGPSRARLGLDRRGRIGPPAREAPLRTTVDSVADYRS